MPTIPPPPGALPPDDTFGDEEYGRDSPIPPQYASTLQQASVAITSALADTHAHIDTQISAAEAALSSAQSDVYGSIASQIGAADTAMRAVIPAVNKAIQKVLDTAFSALVHAEEDLRAVGVAIPSTIEQRIIDMDDPTGENMLARLQGEYPTTPPSVGALGPYQGSPSDGSSDSGASGEAGVDPPVDIASPQDEPEAPQAVPGVSSGSMGEPECGCAEAKPVEACPAPVITVTCPGAEVSLPPPVSPGTVPEEEEGGGGGGTGGGGASEVSGVDLGLAMATGTVPELVASAVSPPPPMPPEPLPDWSDPAICARLNEFQRYYHDLGGGEAVGGGSWQSSISQIYRGAVTTFKTYADLVFTGNDKTIHDEAMKANAHLTGDILGGYSALAELFPQLKYTSALDKQAVWNIGLVLAQAARAGSDTSFPTELLALPLTYMFNSLTPTALPSQGELDGMYQTGFMAQSQWECLTKAQGNIPSLRDMVVHASAPRPNISEVVQLQMRGVLPDAKTYSDLTRRAGVMDDGVVAQYEALARFVPGASDLVRFMVRDAFDPAVVTLYGYDTDFALKFYGPNGAGNPGPAAKWARAQGITEDEMRAYWYAHWEIPSNTALYEMMHRLRPDRPSVQSWDRAAAANGEVAAKNAFGPRPLVVTQADVQKAIEINDMAPGWVNPLVQTSYHPINRTDAIDAYFSGAFTEEDLYHAMRDNGYDADNARRLVDIQRAKRGGRLANASGVWTQRQIVAAYMDGVINGQRTDNLLAPLVTDAGVRQQIIVGADQRVEARVTAAKISTIKRQFYVGMNSAEFTEAQLALLGVGESRRVAIVSQWQSARDGRLREPTAKMVLDWAKGGVISLIDLALRLKNLGYMDSDINRMVALVAKNQESDAKKRAEAEKKDAQKAVKDQAAARRNETKDLERRQKDILKFMKDYEKELARINKELAARPAGGRRASLTIPPESSGMS